MNAGCELVDFSTCASLNKRMEDVPGHGEEEVSSMKKPPSQMLGMIRKCELLVDRWNCGRDLGSSVQHQTNRETWRGAGVGPKQLVMPWQKWVGEAKVELAVPQLGIAELECSQVGLLKGSSIGFWIKRSPWWPVGVSQGSRDYQYQTTLVSGKEEALILSPSTYPSSVREELEPGNRRTKASLSKHGFHFPLQGEEVRRDIKEKKITLLLTTKVMGPEGRKEKRCKIHELWLPEWRCFN